MRALGFLLALFALAAILPAPAGAQPPMYLTQWGSHGRGNGQFDFPVDVATDAAGDVYVADGGCNCIKKFTGTGTFLTRWGSQAERPDAAPGVSPARAGGRGEGGCSDAGSEPVATPGEFDNAA